jgi:hypothetical protein
MNALGALGLFTLATVLAFLVESFIEYLFGTPMDKIPKLQPYKWVLMYFALGAGAGLTFYYKLDLVAILPVWLAELLNKPLPNYEPTTVGILLSGLSVGRGSNFLHQLMSKFFPVKPTQPDIPSTPYPYR